MKFLKKFNLVFLMLLSVLIFDKNVYAIMYPPLPVSSLSDNFPESYRPYINSLKEKHPNWIFKAVNTGLDWNYAVCQESYETNIRLSAIPSYYPDPWKYKVNGNDQVIESYWVTASKQAIAYCLDPRNYLTEKGVFQFETLSFNASNSSIDIINKTLSPSLMSSPGVYSNKYKNNNQIVDMGKTYADIIYGAGQANNTSPTHIATRMVQETGGDILNNLSINGSFSGLTGLYNYFNIGASPDANGNNAIRNGLLYASSKGWTNPTKAINDGVSIIANNYIRWGQDTIYFQKFDVNNPGQAKYLFKAQYMTNILAPQSESTRTYNGYTNSGKINNAFEFHIPVYNNMPSKPIGEPGVGQDLYDHWGESIIRKWIDKGVTAADSKTGMYYPDQPILRSDIMYTINRLMNYTEMADISYIKDVKSTDWYYNDVKKAVKAGYIYPFNLNYINPNSYVNREQFMTMISIALNLPNANLNVLDKYADKNNISKVNKQFVANYIGKFGFAGNMVNGKLCLIPQNVLTKADTMYFINLAFDNYDNTKKVVNNRPNDTVGHWSDSIIEQSIIKGITSSHNITKCFYPDEYILKADIIYTLNRLMKYTEEADVTEVKKYTDVSQNEWYYSDVRKALKVGYIYPLGISNIYPNSKVTREQLFVMVSKAKNLPNAELSVLDKYADKYLIDNTIIQYVANYVKAYGFAGNVINGKLCLIPKNLLTKADTMYFINNIK